MTEEKREPRGAVCEREKERVRLKGERAFGKKIPFSHYVTRGRISPVTAKKERVFAGQRGEAPDRVRSLRSKKKAFVDSTERGEGNTNTSKKKAKTCDETGAATVGGEESPHLQLEMGGKDHVHQQDRRKGRKVVGLKSGDPNVRIVRLQRRKKGPLFSAEENLLQHAPSRKKEGGNFARQERRRGRRSQGDLFFPTCHSSLVGGNLGLDSRGKKE